VKNNYINERQSSQSIQKPTIEHHNKDMSPVPQKLQQFEKNLIKYRRLRLLNFFLTIAFLIITRNTDDKFDTTTIGVHNWLILWCIVHRTLLITELVALIPTVGHLIYTELTTNDKNIVDELLVQMKNKPYYSKIWSRICTILSVINIPLGLYTIWQYGSIMQYGIMCMVYLISVDILIILHARKHVKKLTAV